MRTYTVAKIVYIYRKYTTEELMAHPDYAELTKIFGKPDKICEEELSKLGQVEDNEEYDDDQPGGLGHILIGIPLLD